MENKMSKDIDLKLAFEKASGLIEGLNLLKNMPGSKVEFDLDDIFDNAVLINTNISTPKSVEMTIFVYQDGGIKGDDGRSYKAKEVLEFATKRAKKQGLIP